jgi:hypothetical protein
VRFLSSTGVTPLEVGTYRVRPERPLLDELRSLLGGDPARLERDPALASAAASSSATD